jgi:hypothetical protein
VELRGAVGVVRWVYHTAAALKDCSITRAEDQRHYYVVARVVEANTFLLEHAQPLVFELALAGGRTWRWPIESCGVSDDADHGIVFRAYVGPSLQ